MFSGLFSTQRVREEAPNRQTWQKIATRTLWCKIRKYWKNKKIENGSATENFEQQHRRKKQQQKIPLKIYIINFIANLIFKTEKKNKQSDNQTNEFPLLSTKEKSCEKVGDFAHQIMPWKNEFNGHWMTSDASTSKSNYEI